MFPKLRDIKPMLSLLTLLQATSMPVSPTPHAQLFAALEGQWACSGAFASGKPLSADLSFARSADGNILHYKHVDRLPRQA
jgi:hypothetical protein